MTNAVTAMTTNITPTALWEQVGTVMPFVATMVIFCFGFLIVKKVIRKASGGRAGV